MEVATSGVNVLPYTASSVGEARRRLTKELTAAGVAESPACDAILVLSELVSNALRHAIPLPGGTVRVTWELGSGGLRLEVSDGGGETVPRVHEPTGSALGGRGLGIVDRLSLRWGVRRDAGTSTVWAELPTGQPGSGESRECAANQGAASQGTSPALVIASSLDA
jgi:anti-sigma regulatory factor (Ser/Thr protein kinase)